MAAKKKAKKKTAKKTLSAEELVAGLRRRDGHLPTRLSEEAYKKKIKKTW